MANTVKDLVKKAYSFFSEKRNVARKESQEYLHVENQFDSDEDGIVYPSEEMQRKSDHGEEEPQQTEKNSEKTSALQAAWNILNLIQGEFKTIFSHNNKSND